MEENKNCSPEAAAQAPSQNSFMSPSISNLAQALSVFQGSIHQPGLDKEVKVQTKNGQSYKFRYADLSACIKAAAPCLKECGLAVLQLVQDGKLITLLTHKSGEWMKSVVYLPQQSNDYQAFGSALTYLKRYTYCALLGIVAEDDDDANYAQGNQYNMSPAKQAAAAPAPKPDPTPDSVQQAIAKALSEVVDIKDMKGYKELWAKWKNEMPGICGNGTPFYKAMAEKRKQLDAVTKQAV